MTTLRVVQGSECELWLAVASEDASICVYELSSGLVSERENGANREGDEASIKVVMLRGHLAGVTSLCWSPHNKEQLLSGRYATAATR